MRRGRGEREREREGGRMTEGCLVEEERMAGVPLSLF